LEQPVVVVDHAATDELPVTVQPENPARKSDAQQV